MKIQRAAAIPLITHDPYFSIWSPADNLYDADTAHWSGLRQKITGFVTVNGEKYRFLGAGEGPVIAQTALAVSATATEYTFACPEMELQVKWTSPLIPGDLDRMSRPCTYLDFAVQRKVPCEVKVELEFASELVQRGEDELQWAEGEYADYAYAEMGCAKQTPLGSSGDNITIDWGYLYLACQQGKVLFDREGRCLRAELDLGGENTTAGLIVAFDDLCSINYFGNWCRGYWTRRWPTMFEAIRAAFADREETFAMAKALDADVEEKAVRSGGEKYAFLCAMSFRHSICAHKLIADENGEVAFLSKENDSNGCIGTVDVSYPSIPMYLIYNPELVKGMIRPVMRFAACDAWEFDFAPHDVGRYPYAWGQVYGANHAQHGTGRVGFTEAQDTVNPPFYAFPAGSNLYNLKYQMPVEECGNMLIMTAVVCALDGNADFAKPYMAQLDEWVKYLIENGEDPGEQLCTDDFAGHLEHNVNLSAKAIMGVEAYSVLLKLAGECAKAEEYHQLAAKMAGSLEARAFAGDHYTLVYGTPESWSLKYNTVWDRFFGSGLFTPEFYAREMQCYMDRANAYGVPLDNRATYTKSDWELWTAAMTDDVAMRSRIIDGVAEFLEKTPSRYPFSDWYDTISGEYCHFKGRSVQGGIFMPILIDSCKK